jgi:putative membrane protein
MICNRKICALSFASICCATSLFFSVMLPAGAQTTPPASAPSAPIRPTAPPQPGAPSAIPGGVTPQPGSPIRPVPLQSGAAGDRQFAILAANGGMAEVIVGKLAATRGSSDTVRSLGARMVRDHSKANAQLASIAKDLGIVLPTSLDTDGQMEVQRLQALHGAAFDRAYVSMQVTDHQKTAELMREESMNGSAASLRSFATQTLPIVQQHLTAFTAVMPM